MRLGFCHIFIRSNFTAATLADIRQEVYFQQDVIYHYITMPMKNDEEQKTFEKFKESLLKMDPVSYCERYLTLDGKPFRLHGNGYKPFADIYRYIGIKALEKSARPVIMVKGRQVGGTTMAQCLEMYFMGSGLFGAGGAPPIRILHAFPQLEMSAQYSKTKLGPMIASSVIDEEDKKNISGKVKTFMQKMLDPGSASGDSLGFKQFLNGNFIRIDSTGLDADRIRGSTFDGIFFDEVQDTSGTAIANAIKTLAKAQYGAVGDGVQVYFGTPKKKGSDFYKMWEASSQQYYHLGCGNCEKFFPLYTPGSDDWEKIWLHGFIVKCTHCGFEQDKRDAAERGKWIGLKGDDETLMIGFHLNQLYMPDFPKEKIMAEKPGTHPINTERAYQNEVLGEFFQGDSSPITPEEIRDKCGDVGRKMKARIMPGEEQIVVLGIDYGARSDMEQLANPNKSKTQGQSYSTGVILTAKGPNLLSIEFATKFKRNDVESKKGIIDNIMRQYSVQLAIGDIGFSQDFSTILHTAYGDRYLVSRASNKINNKIKFNEEIFPKEILFERDFYIGELFELMKKGQVKFPFGDYEKIAWLVSHCSSMDIKPSISRYGDPTVHYVKGSTPNDGLMALLNAYIAYKFILTNGFTNNNPLLQQQDLKNKNKPLAILGMVKRRF